MTKRSHFLHGWTVGLALVLASLLVAPGFAQDTRNTAAYDVTLQAPDMAFQYEDYELTVEVKNLQGQPVNGVPVVFSVEADWRSDARVFPRQAVTQDGVARTSFQSNMPGEVNVTAQAGGAFDTNEITVTATGSTIYQDEQRPRR